MGKQADKTLKHSQDADGAEKHLGHVSPGGVEHIEDVRWGGGRGEGTRSVSPPLLAAWSTHARRRDVSGDVRIAETRTQRSPARDVFLRDPGTYELATGKETVRHELARAEGARGVRHGGYASNEEACFVPYVPYKRASRLRNRR